MAYYNDSAIRGQFGTRRVDDSLWANPGNPFGSDVGRDYLDTEQDGRFGYGRFQKGVGGNSRFQDYMRRNFYNVQSGYGQEVGNNPYLRFTDYLTQNQDKFVQDYDQENFGPGARGERQKSGRLRWLTP